MLYKRYVIRLKETHWRKLPEICSRFGKGHQNWTKKLMENVNDPPNGSLSQQCEVRVCKMRNICSVRGEKWTIFVSVWSCLCAKQIWKGVKIFGMKWPVEINRNNEWKFEDYAMNGYECKFLLIKIPFCCKNIMI